MERFSRAARILIDFFEHLPDDYPPLATLLAHTIVSVAELAMSPSNRPLVVAVNESEAILAYRPMVYAFMRRAFSDPSLVEDLCQEVWLLAFANHSALARPEARSAWLLTICRTVRSRERRRRERTNSSGLLMDAPDPQESIEESLIRAERRACLLEAIHNLPIRQREVALRRLLHCKSIAEVAAELNCASGTVKATLHAALNALRAQLMAGTADTSRTAARLSVDLRT